MRARGIEVHAITAEPGGEAKIRQRLSRYGLPPLRFAVHSDPQWRLMACEPRGQIYIPNPSHPFLLKAGAFDEPYTMCQPALVVLDDARPAPRVRYWWSWNKLQAGAINDDGVLPNARREGNADGNTHDVRFRPVPADLLHRLAAAVDDGGSGGGGGGGGAGSGVGHGPDLEGLRVENLGFPDGADHVNVKRSLRRDPAEHRRKQQARGEATDIQALETKDPVAKL